MSRYLLCIFIFQVLKQILGLVGASPNVFHADDGKQKFLSPFTVKSIINPYGNFIGDFTQNNALAFQEISIPSVPPPLHYLPGVFYAVLPLRYNYWDIELQRLYESYIFHRIQGNFGHKWSLNRNYGGYNVFHPHFYKNEPNGNLYFEISKSLEWQTPFTVYEFPNNFWHANVLQLDYELLGNLNNLQWLTTYGDRGFYGRGFFTPPCFYGLQPLYKNGLFIDQERLALSRLDWQIPYEIDYSNYLLNIDLLFHYAYLEFFGLLPNGFNIHHGLPWLSNINEYFFLHEPELIIPLSIKPLETYYGGFIPLELGNENHEVEPYEILNLHGSNLILNEDGYLGRPSGFINKPIGIFPNRFWSMNVPVLHDRYTLNDEHSLKLPIENKVQYVSQEYYKYPKKREATKIIPYLFDYKQYTNHEGPQEYTPFIYQNCFGQHISDRRVNKEESIGNTIDIAPYLGDLKSEPGNERFHFADRIPYFGNIWNNVADVEKPFPEYVIEVEVKVPITTKEEKKFVNNIDAYKVAASENIIKTEANSGIVDKQRATTTGIRNVEKIKLVSTKEKDSETNLLTTIKSINKASKKNLSKLQTPNTNVIKGPKPKLIGLPNIPPHKEVKPINVEQKGIVAAVIENKIWNVRDKSFNSESISLNKEETVKSQKLEPLTKVTKHLKDIITNQQFFKKQSSVFEEKVLDFKKNLHILPKEKSKPTILVKSETPFLKEPTLITLPSKPDVRVKNIVPIIVDTKLPINLKRSEGESVFLKNVFNKDLSNALNKNTLQLSQKPKLIEKRRNFDYEDKDVQEDTKLLKTPEQKKNLYKENHYGIHAPKTGTIIKQVSAGNKITIFEELKTHEKNQIVTQEVVRPGAFTEKKRSELYPLVVPSPKILSAGISEILDVNRIKPVFSKEPTLKLKNKSFFNEITSSKSSGEQKSNIFPVLKNLNDEKHSIIENTKPIIKLPVLIRNDIPVVSPKIIPRIDTPKEVLERTLIQPIPHKGKTKIGSGWKGTDEINSVFQGENKLSVFKEVKIDSNEKTIIHDKVSSVIPQKDKLPLTIPKNKDNFFDRLPVRISGSKPTNIKKKKQEYPEFKNGYIPEESKHKPIIKNEANVFQNSKIFSTERFQIEEKRKLPVKQGNLNSIEITRRIPEPGKGNTPLKVDSTFPFIQKDAQLILRKEEPPSIVKEKKFPFSDEPSQLEFEKDFFGDKLKDLNFFDKGSGFFREEKINLGSKGTLEEKKPEILDHPIPIIFKGTKPIFMEDEKSIFPANLKKILLKGSFRNNFEEIKSSKDKHLTMTHDVKQDVTYPKLSKTLNKIGSLVRRDFTQSIKPLPIVKGKHNSESKNKITNFPTRSVSFGDIKSTLSKQENTFRKEDLVFKEISNSPAVSEKRLPIVEDVAKTRKVDILQNNNLAPGHNIISYVPIFMHGNKKIDNKKIENLKSDGFQGLRAQKGKSQHKETKSFKEKTNFAMKSKAVAKEDPLLKKHIYDAPIIVTKQVPPISQSTPQDKVTVFKDLKAYGKKAALVQDKKETPAIRDYKSIQVDRAPNSFFASKKNNILPDLKLVISQKEMHPNVITSKMPVSIKGNKFNSPFNILPGPKKHQDLFGGRQTILPDKGEKLKPHKTPFPVGDIKSLFTGDKALLNVNYKIPSLFGESEVTIPEDIKTQDKSIREDKENIFRPLKKIISDEVLKSIIAPIENNVLLKEETPFGSVQRKPIILSPTESILLNQKSLGKPPKNKINIIEDLKTYNTKHFLVKENIKLLPEIKQSPIITHSLPAIPLAKKDKFKTSNVKESEEGIVLNNLYTSGNKENIFIDGVKHVNDGNKLHISLDTRGPLTSYDENKNPNLFDKRPFIFEKKFTLNEEPKENAVRHKKGILTKDLKEFQSYFENTVPKLIDNERFYDNDEYVFQHGKSPTSRDGRRFVIEGLKQYNPIYGKFAESIKSLAGKQKIEESKTHDNTHANGITFGSKKIVNIKSDIGYPYSHGAENGKGFIIGNRKGYKFEDSKLFNTKNEKEFEQGSGDKSFEVDKIKDYVYGFKNGHEDSEDYYNRKDLGMRPELNYGDVSLNGNEYKKFDGTGDLKSYGLDLSKGTGYSDGDSKVYAFGHNKDYAFALKNNVGLGNSLKYGKERNHYGKTSKQSFDSNKIKSFLFGDKHLYNNDVDVKKLKNYKLQRNRGESLTDKFGFTAGKTFDLEKGIEKAFKIRL